MMPTIRNTIAAEKKTRSLAAALLNIKQVFFLNVTKNYNNTVYCVWYLFRLLQQCGKTNYLLM